MNKKYQVFISSTYTDLKEERLAVTQILLEMGCVPVGMEQFPASDMSQMDYIKMMLDDCDYYILILAGRYGALDSDGIGFTEKEYDYAVKKGIPIMSFVIRDAGILMSDKCEKTDAGRKMLDDFHKKVCEGKLVKHYTDCGTLQAAVAISLSRCIQDSPAVGWIRGNSVETPEGIEARIEQYMQKHIVSKKDIEDLFAEDTFILDANSHSTEEPQKSTPNFIPFDGACTMVEELSKRLPKVEWGEF